MYRLGSHSCEESRRGAKSVSQSVMTGAGEAFPAASVGSLDGWKVLRKYMHDSECVNGHRVSGSQLAKPYSQADPLSPLWSAPLSVAEAAAYNDPPVTRYIAIKSAVRVSGAWSAIDWGGTMHRGRMCLIAKATPRCKPSSTTVNEPTNTNTPNASIQRE